MSLNNNDPHHHHMDHHHHHDQQHPHLHHDPHMEPIHLTGRHVGQCGLGFECSAPGEELSDEFKCRYCGKQLHGFVSGCSKPRNEADFRDGVICKDQPCVAMLPNDDDDDHQHDAAMMEQQLANNMYTQQPHDGVQRSAAMGHPEFLWQTQRAKRKRDPTKPKPTRQRYTKEQKETILGMYLENPNAKLQDVAKEFGIPEGTLRGWYDEDKRNKAQADQSQPGYHAEEESTTAAASLQNTSPEMEQEEPQKKRRMRYSNETKIQVILALETRPNASVKDVAKEFGVAVGTARGWIEEADKIQKQATENRRAGAKANPSKDPMRKIWDAILRLFELNSRLPDAQQLDLNVAVVKAIGIQARDILLDRYKHDKSILSETEAKSIDKFKASETWARKWAKDHQVISAKSTANPMVVAQDRLVELQHIVAGYPSEHVYAMATTSLFYRILPHQTYVSTIDDKMMRACKGLKSKDRLTVYICVNETGKDKLPIACIGKYDNPACIQVHAQQILPYLSQKQALSDAGTFQRWWRSTFLPHVRSRYQNGEKILLLVDADGPCKADLLKDPTGQVRVEALPVSPNAGQKNSDDSPNSIQQVFGGVVKDETASSKREAPQCQPMAFDIIETIKRRYRYRLLQEIMNAYSERIPRRKIANDADYPISSRGLREGSMVNLCDAMRLLDGIWSEVASTTIIRSWQRTKLRLKQMIPPEFETKRGSRIKSEKRQTTREKKQLVDDLQAFLTSHDKHGLVRDDGSNMMEEAIENLKACFFYSDETLISQQEIFDSLEEWIFLEESDPVVNLFREEIKEEMNILYLAGLEEMPETTIPEADEPEEPELEESKIKANSTKAEELDYEKAVELAGNIKATAVKLLRNGNILGDLAVKLDDATDSIFSLLRKQQAAAKEKQEMEEAQSTMKRTPKQKSPQENAADANSMPPPAPIQGPSVAQLDENVMAGVDLSDITVTDIAGATVSV
ncbi:DDE superfamily endonuclease [Nitzschia inconspicua]|uniref:DDE superfamily endonuclease n=1 Tax=Nitzschia inconspicua TaxID=303405 RepID=A0A9K3KWG9_9STRA|nr:DDE superfamily endonuclease [Nitzschia inconspicua]